ncbi:hypothetical protein [Halomicrobium sp. LC1Hm]|uniref:hypothetical protein n=1 Tax=Halomicrobium sp. LC1Hm TaxID=2610902 RepID=UPI0012983A55|nr:hypothetical protein [Halomicrobium sp. LC1Hm]QGA83704.1 hypothetical protein LC1Hm_2671 [Halomicrobium sp. LC1Hm]
MTQPADEQQALRAQANPEVDFDYELVTINHSAAIDPGDEILFDLYISGYGSPAKNKLTMLTNPSILPETHRIGTVSLSVDGLVDWEENVITDLTIGSQIDDSKSYVRYMPLTRYGITIGVPRIFFADDFEWGEDIRSNPDIEMDEVMERYYPRTLSEKVLPLSEVDADNISESQEFVPEDGENEGPVTPSPPMRFKIQTSEDADPGDYDIRLVLALGNEEAVETISDNVTVHINNTREQLEPLPTTAAVVGAFIALLSLVHATGIFGVLLSLIT